MRPSALCLCAALACGKPDANADAPARQPAAEAAAPAYSLEARTDPAWPGSTAQLLPVAVRAAAHDGFERVVIELHGSGAPGWRVAYVPAAIADGSGEELDVAGDHTLQVTLTGIRTPEGADLGRLARGRHPATDTALIKEVRVGPLFEGQSQIFIGLAARAPYRVATLTAPPRLVIDVQTAAE